MWPEPPPPAVPRPRSAPFWRAVTIAVVVAIVLTIAIGSGLVATRLPYAHRAAEDFDLPGETPEHSCGASPSFGAPHGGSLSFSWATNNSQVGQMRLLEFTPEGGLELTLYYQISSGGSASFPTTVGDQYGFEFCGAANQSATISGSIVYESPWL